MADPFASSDVDEIDLEKEENLVNVREYGKRADKRARKLERENEALQERLKTLETKDQVSAAEAEATKRGVSPEQWKQLLELKPEPTTEDVEKFAKAVGANPALSTAKVEEAREGTPVTETNVPAVALDPGFSPAPGSQLPADAVEWKTIKDAIARGDDAFLTRITKEALASGKQVDFGPFAHLIGADSNDE